VIGWDDSPQEGGAKGRGCAGWRDFFFLAKSRMVSASLHHQAFPLRAPPGDNEG